MNLDFLFIITFLVLNSASVGCVACKVDVQQSMKLMRETEHRSVSIPCSVNISSCSHFKLQISWYVFRKDQIDLIRQSLYAPENQDLKINSLSKADSGVYYCAAALLEMTHSEAQAIGQGTTLKVSESRFIISEVLLLTLLVLLIVYSLLILGFIICIKVQTGQSFFKRRWNKSEKKEDSARKVLFSGVVQELYKRNLVGDQFQAHNKVPQDKSEGLQNVHHNEDIYQNLDQ